MNISKLEIKDNTSEMIKDGAHSAAICYTSNPWEDIVNEDTKKTKDRIQQTLENGHHSVYEHNSISLNIEGIPKILAMFLNNEKVYSTSEQSGRYTVMENIPEEEKILYEKWRGIFQTKISEKYPKIGKKILNNLSKENARYMISVFTETNMRYTTNLRQINYICNWMEEFVQGDTHDDFFHNNLKTSIVQFLEGVQEYRVDGMESGKERELSFISDRNKDMFEEYFGLTYSTVYKGSFAQIAQAQRHRTISYFINLPEYPTQFYIPEILREDEKLVREWLVDLQSVASHWPQATMIEIYEMGTVENFILKCWERLCGKAQLEIMVQTEKTLGRYFQKTKNEKIREFLFPYMRGARCTFPNSECKEPCSFGRGALRRKI